MRACVCDLLYSATGEIRVAFNGAENAAARRHRCGRFALCLYFGDTYGGAHGRTCVLVAAAAAAAHDHVARLDEAAGKQEDVVFASAGSVDGELLPVELVADD